MAEQKIDSITLDIIKDSLAAAGEEMFISIARSSKSPVIYEVLDFASGITDAEGKLLTQGNGITGFIGMLSGLATDVLEKWHKSGEMHPGDIFIANDPYAGGGSHLSDVGMIMPIFNGEHLIAMSVAKAHWTEVGGKNPGSWSVDASEVFQEGLRFPCLKIADRGKIDRNLVEMIRANVRFPEQTIGDMWSQIAGLKTAERRIQEISNKFGEETLLLAMRTLIESSAAASRRMVMALPQGEFSAQQWIDDDGLGTGPINIDVKVTIKAGRFIVDFTGSHAQVTGPINMSSGVLISTCRTMFLAVTNAEMEVNDGIFAPIEIIAERGSIVNCVEPASVSICWESMLPAIDAISLALAEALPNKIPASNLCTVGAFIIAGTQPETGVPFLNTAPSLGGHGAGMGMDGQAAQFCLTDGETFNIPVEILESRYGYHVEYYKLNTGVNAGAGEFRGGPGLVRSYRMRTNDVYFTGAYGRHKSRPWGFAGGQDGSSNFFEILRAQGPDDAPIGKGTRVHLNKGDALKVTTSIGGGYGDPLKRPAEQVAMDVKNEYITPEIAEQVYGVLVGENGVLIGVTSARAE